jgi:hypothetical protein
MPVFNPCSFRRMEVPRYDVIYPLDGTRRKYNVQKYCLGLTWRTNELLGRLSL